MKALKHFEEFLKEGTMRRVSIDKERAKSLILGAERKIRSLHKNREKVGLDDENANEYIESCYDILLFLIRAKLYQEGYAGSGQGAHEAEVSFTRRLHWNEKEVQFLDQIRFFRNRMLYYGSILDKEYAEKVLTFTEKMYDKLRKGAE